MSEVPQGSVPGLTQFHIFVGDTGIEGTLSKFPDNPELCGVVSAPGGRDGFRGTFTRGLAREGGPCKHHTIQHSKVPGPTPGLQQSQTHPQAG